MWGIFSEGERLILGKLLKEYWHYFWRNDFLNLGLEIKVVNKTFTVGWKLSLDILNQISIYYLHVIGWDEYYSSFEWYMFNFYFIQAWFRKIRWRFLSAWNPFTNSQSWITIVHRFSKNNSLQVSMNSYPIFVSEYTKNKPIIISYKFWWKFLS